MSIPTPMERAAAAMAAGPRLSPKCKSDKRPDDASGAAPASSASVRFGKKEKNLASDGHTSTRDTDEKAMRYVRILQEGANGTPGILAKYDGEGDELIPYMHQRQAVKKAAEIGRNFMLMAHDAGTGKTATFFQLFAAIELLVGGGACCIITVPPSTLPQWENTAHDWLNLKNKSDAIVCTTKAKKITTEMLAKVRVLVVSRHLLAGLYKQCWEYRPEYERNERGRWVAKWVRKEGVPLHPIWEKKWDLMGVDEAHFMRNPITEWCVAHHQLASGIAADAGPVKGGCRKRIALTATPVCNKPQDMVGLCKAINAADEFQQKTFWSMDRQCKTINPSTVKLFKPHTDRVKDDILKLPPIHQMTHNFAAGLTEADAIKYNTHLHGARRLRIRLEQSAISTQDLQKLMLLLQRMQQTLVSPRLAEMGAEYFQKNPSEIEDAARVDTGSLKELHRLLVSLQAQGHARIMVASNHVTLMQIAKKYLERKNNDADSASVGNIFIYDGTLSLSQRQAQRMAFLTEERTVLFLSIGAGGTGLHLVPTRRDTPKDGFCRACVFWGSRPFSPQQVWQTLKRIHRIGQKHDVFVHHMVAHGSVDYAINCVHGDKAGLANAIVDDDWSNCDEVGGEWRRTGRIMDQCCEMMPDGNFPEEGATPLLHEHKAARGTQDATQRRVGQLPPPRASLVSQFFRQPLQEAAAAIASTTAAAPVSGRKRDRPDAQDTEPWRKEAPRRTLPLPAFARTVPFGPATIHTAHPPSAAALQQAQ